MKSVKFIKRGFTLMELLVAIMIIGILAAVAVPQYQKAVMKSRFAAMMPIAKTLANANEVYYAEHDEYSTDPAKLNVTPQAGTPDGTAINMYSNPEEVSFVRVENPGVPNARYVVYQKLSENFPETTWCEAGDTRTEELCVALGGTLPEGVTGNSSGDNTNYKAYLLTGQARSGDKFAETGTETEPQTPTCPENSVCDEEGNVTGCASGYHLEGNACVETPPCPENSVCDEQGNVTGCSTGYKLSEGSCVEIPPCQGVSCDEQGNITKCPNGKTLHNGECVACDIPNAATCSTTAYKAASCNKGYLFSDGTCITPQYNCPKSKVGSELGSESQATCTQVCEDEDNPECYKWTGGRTYANKTDQEKYCQGRSSYECSGITFRGKSTSCAGFEAYACSGSVFISSGTSSSDQTSCSGYKADGCTGSTFSGQGAFCWGLAENGCNGAIILSGAHCNVSKNNACNGALYGFTQGESQMGSCVENGASCPTGVPVRTQTVDYTTNPYTYTYNYTWKGNCCNPAYMVSGVCPSGIAICQ